uniref:Extensin n=1 Tax=Solanum tuberosum TaxID=4113 RepID=M0ZW17_SOLTU
MMVRKEYRHSTSATVVVGRSFELAACGFRFHRRNGGFGICLEQLVRGSSPELEARGGGYFWCRGGSDGKGFGGGVALCVAGEDAEKWGLGFVSGEEWVLWCLMAESRGMSDGGGLEVAGNGCLDGGGGSEDRRQWVVVVVLNCVRRRDRWSRSDLELGSRKIEEKMREMGLFAGESGVFWVVGSPDSGGACHR